MHRNYIFLALFLAILEVDSIQVNLINPTFKSAEVTGCELTNNTLNCTLQLETRAGKYRVSNIYTKAPGIINPTFIDTAPIIERIGDWRDPKTWTLGPAGTTKKPQQLEAGILKDEINFSAFGCQVRAYIKNNIKSFFCYRDPLIAKCEQASNETVTKCQIIRTEFNFSLSSMVVEEKLDGTILFALDSIGHLLVYHEQVDRGYSNLTLERKYMLNALADDLANHLNMTETSKANNDLLMSKEALKNKATRHLKERLEFTYITAISPTDQDYRSVKPLNNFCLFNGMRSTKREGLYCSSSMGKKEQTYSRIDAISFVTKGEDIIQNLFYSKKLSDEPDSTILSLYSHCKVKKENLGDISNCEPKGERVRMAPNDIVPIYDAKQNCSKQILFYQEFYQVFDLEEVLTKEATIKHEPILNLNFHAAFSHNGYIYFFSGPTSLLRVRVTMADSKCDSLVVDFKDLKEMYSQDYMFKMLKMNFSDGQPPPLLINYQELAAGDSDTQPSIFLKPEDIVPPTKEPNESSNIVVICIAFIVGGLILAGMIYVCFIMWGSGSGAATGDRRAPPKSRRAKAIAQANDGADSLNHAKTLRSHIQSKISSPGKSVGSKRGPKSTKQSPKSKRSKGRVMPAGKSPTSLTTVKVTRGEPIPMTRDHIVSSPSAASGGGSAAKSPVAAAPKSNSSATKSTPRSPRTPSPGSSTTSRSPKSPK